MEKKKILIRAGCSPFEYLTVKEVSDDNLFGNNVGNLLYAGTGHAVDTVFVAGNLKVRNKKIQNFDEESVLRKCNDLIHKLNVRTGYVKE